MRNLLKSKKGFTLVEIVIVIAIIGILIVVLVPNVVNQYRNYRLNSTKQAVAKGIVKNLEVGISGGTIPLDASAAGDMTFPASEEKFIGEITTEGTAIGVNKIKGISNLYDLPTNNGDLMDPLATQGSTDADLYYRAYWDSANRSVIVINSKSAADVVRSGSTVGVQNYGKTQGGLVNPLYAN